MSAHHKPATEQRLRAPCDGCPHWETCRHGAICDVFNRFVVGRAWRNMERLPTPEAARASTRQFAKALQLERREDQRAKSRIRFAQWYRKNRARVLERKRKADAARRAQAQAASMTAPPEPSQLEQQPAAA